MANQYFTCVLDAWRDGKTLYGRMHYYRSGTYTYQDSSFPNPTMDLNGTTYTDTDFGNRVRSGIAVGDVYSTTFSRTVAGTGDRTVTWSAGSGARSDFAGTWSKTVNFPVEYTAPSNPTISNVSTTIDTLTGTLNLSSWGNPSSGRFEYYFGTTSDTTSDYTLSPASGYSSSKTASINKTGLTSNQHYYIRYRVWNQQLNNPSGLILGGAYITKPAASTNHTVDNVEMTSVRINWNIPADGGHYDKNYYYSLDNGSTWVLAKTYSGGSAGTGSCTITGLSINTTYTVKFKVTTDAGTTNCPDFTFATTGGLYGSVSGKTKQIKKMYGSVNGQTKQIKKLYASVGGVTKRVF